VKFSTSRSTQCSRRSIRSPLRRRSNSKGWPSCEGNKGISKAALVELVIGNLPSAEAALVAALLLLRGRGLGRVLHLKYGFSTWN
jgi:hypothetical protein